MREERGKGGVTQKAFILVVLLSPKVGHNPYGVPGEALADPDSDWHVSRDGKRKGNQREEESKQTKAAAQVARGRTQARRHAGGKVCLAECLRRRRIGTAKAVPANV